MSLETSTNNKSANQSQRKKADADDDHDHDSEHAHISSSISIATLITAPQPTSPYDTLPLIPISSVDPIDISTMMMERAKTAPAPKTTATEHEKPAAAAAPAESSAPAANNASAEKRVEDLERRLNDLGGPSAAPADASAPAATPAAAVAEAPTKPKESQTGKNNPLLKRIQAAQERARLAEQKEKDAKLAASAEIERIAREQEEAQLRAAEEERIQKAQTALRSVAGRALADKALEDKQKSILAQLEGKSPPEPEAAVPIMKTMDLPPPSFDSMKFPPPKEMQQQIQHPHLQGGSEMVGHGMNSKVLTRQQQPGQAAPPSFDFVEHQQQMMSTPVEAPPEATAPEMSPSAPPPAMADMEHHLHGVQPMAPPFAPEPTQVAMPPPPPSFAQFENTQNAPTEATTNIAQDEDGVFDYDLNGNPLNPQQRQALLDEQRLLYESIMKEKAANDAAIARANADSFDLRSSSAAAAAMPGGSTTAHAPHAGQMRAMDAVGQNVAASVAAAAAGSTTAGAAETDEEQRLASRRMVKIGSNQMVALHGQDRTKKAIKEGTAILVQCINCQNWMQVTDTATLMFCPVCQVVSPVIQQNEVLTKEEAIQLTMDRKLAEKLQAEAYAAEDGEEGQQGETKDQGFMERMFGGIGGAVVDAVDATGEALEGTARSASAGSAGSAQSDTWWNKISSVVGYGVEKERANMSVSRPPGAPASMYPAQRRGSPTNVAINDSTSRSPTHNEEHRGLLTPVVDGSESSALPPARVAESKPLFSCIADSVTSATSAVFSTGETNVHGNDQDLSSSLLITNAGRGVGDGAGDYSRVNDQD